MLTPIRNIFWSVISLRIKPFLTCSHHKFHQDISSADPSDPKTKENCITRMLVSRTDSLQFGNGVFEMPAGLFQSFVEAKAHFDASFIR